MHVSSFNGPVEIRWRDIVLLVARVFLDEYSLHAEGILFLMDCAVGPKVTVSVIRPIHTCDIIGPQSKLQKEIRGLEEDIFYVYLICELYCLIAERAG